MADSRQEKGKGKDWKSESLRDWYRSLPTKPKTIEQFRREVYKRFHVLLSRNEAKRLMIQLRNARPVNYLPKSMTIPESWHRTTRVPVQNEYGYVLRCYLDNGRVETFTLGADKPLSREEIERRAREGWDRLCEISDPLKQLPVKPKIVKIEILDAYRSVV